MLNYAFILALVVAVVARETLATVCPTTPLYKQEFVPDCISGNEKVLWPYYEDVSLYYRCQGVGNIVLAQCPGNMVFDYYKQACTGCKDYIAAPECSSLILPSGKKPNCVSVTITTATTTTTAQPCTLPKTSYTTAFTPTCVGNDIYMLWPNYYNISQYYRCHGSFNPVLLACPQNTYFNYYAQTCTDCLSYEVAPACEKLKFDKTNKCDKMSSKPPALTQPAKISTTPGPIAACPAIKGYTQTFVPTCTGQDVKVLWPNYENPSEYFLCLGEGMPQLQTCVYKMYFNFYMQRCTNCEEYIPAPECSDLKGFSKNNIVCEKIK